MRYDCSFCCPFGTDNFVATARGVAAGDVPDPREVPEEDMLYWAGFAEMTPETKEWWNKVAAKREQLAEEAKDADDLGTWEWGASLRHQWIAAQRLDKDLAPCFQKVWNPRTIVVSRPTA